MAENKNVIISISTGTILKIVGIFLILTFAYLIRDILLLIFIAVIFATLIEPLADKLEKFKIARGVAVIVIYIILLFFLIITVRLIIPPIAEQVGLLTNNFPDFWVKVTENFKSLQQYSQENGLLDNIKSGLQGLESNLSRAASGVYALIISIFRNVINFIVILVVTYYLVVQKDALSKILKAISPTKYHLYLDELTLKIQQKIGSWARGQLILGLIIGVMVFLGLIFFLPRYALVLAIIAGMTELIPYLGPVLGAIPAVFLGFTVSPFSFWRGFAILIIYVIIQQLENNLIVPQVMKRQVGLNPVVIIMAMLIGAHLAGIVGIILAVPVATIIGIVAKDFIEKSNISGIKDSKIREGGIEE